MRKDVMAIHNSQVVENKDVNRFLKVVINWLYFSRAIPFFY